MSDFIKYCKRQGRDIRIGMGECDTKLGKFLLGYRIGLCLTIIFPLLYISGFLIGCATLTNPFKSGLDLLEEIT